MRAIGNDRIEAELIRGCVAGDKVRSVIFLSLFFCPLY
jgi:hypothetical protein